MIEHMFHIKQFNNHGSMIPMAALSIEYGVGYDKRVVHIPVRTVFQADSPCRVPSTEMCKESLIATLEAALYFLKTDEEKQALGRKVHDLQAKLDSVKSIVK